MKDKIRLGNEVKVLHKGDEGQDPVRESKTFIKGMKDKIRLGNEEKVLHKGNEGQDPVRERGKSPS